MMAQTEMARMIEWLRKYGLTDTEILDLIHYMETGKARPKSKK